MATSETRDLSLRCIIRFCNIGAALAFRPVSVSAIKPVAFTSCPPERFATNFRSLSAPKQMRIFHLPPGPSDQFAFCCSPSSRHFFFPSKYLLPEVFSHFSLFLVDPPQNPPCFLLFPPRSSAFISCSLTPLVAGSSPLRCFTVFYTVGFPDHGFLFPEVDRA